MKKICLLSSVLVLHVSFQAGAVVLSDPLPAYLSKKGDVTAIPFPVGCSYYTEGKCAEDSVRHESLQLDSSQLNIYVDGEPLPKAPPAAFDLALLTAGADLYDNAVWVDVLAHDDIVKARSRPADAQKLSERPIDVYYVSSHCLGGRGALAEVIAKACNKSGLTFVSSGRCQVPSQTSHNATGRWDTSLEVSAKMIIAFDNFKSNDLGEHIYLSEKLFKPMAAGAIPIFNGNGLPLLDVVKVNRNRIIARNEFSTDADFANSIVELVKDKARLDTVGRLPYFLPGAPEWPGQKEARALALTLPKVQALRAKHQANPERQLQVQVNAAQNPNWIVERFPYFEQVLDLPAGSLVRHGRGAHAVDLTITDCCW